jgi:hypothetical protein
MVGVGTFIPVFLIGYQHAQEYKVWSNRYFNERAKMLIMEYNKMKTIVTCVEPIAITTLPSSILRRLFCQ